MASSSEERGASLKDAALFVNVPFCIEPPRYAHGRYLTGDGAAKREYLEAVMREVSSLGDVLEGKRIVAARIGGGSPSVASPDQLGKLMRIVRSELPMAHGAEMSLEAIPNTVGVPSLTGWGQGKPSRIELRVGAIHLRDLDELRPPLPRVGHSKRGAVSGQVRHEQRVRLAGVRAAGADGGKLAANAAQGA